MRFLSLPQQHSYPYTRLQRLVTTLSCAYTQTMEKLEWVGTKISSTVRELLDEERKASGTSIRWILEQAITQWVMNAARERKLAKRRRNA